MTMITSTRQVGGVAIVDISGRIVLGEESAALRELVRDLLSKGHKKILLNLGDVNYIDSSGLGHLVSAFTSVQRQQGELKLLNLTNKVHDLMQITKLYTLRCEKCNRPIISWTLSPRHGGYSLEKAQTKALPLTWVIKECG